MSGGLGAFAAERRGLPTLGFTHYQPAQMTTVGKRATLWCAECLLDLRDLEYRLANLVFRGVKGATGTQASYMALFDGDADKVKQLEAIVAEKMGFEKVAPVTGQTYSRKVDAAVLQALAGVGATVHKFCNDVRWLASGPTSGISEILIPAVQPGSSIMPGKVNPVMCEAMMMVAARVMGNHTTVTIAGQRGNFELNVMMPVLAQALLESIALLSNVARTCAEPGERKQGARRQRSGGRRKEGGWKGR